MNPTARFKSRSSPGAHDEIKAEPPADLKSTNQGGPNRRQFIGSLGIGSVAAGILTQVPSALANNASHSLLSNSGTFDIDNRVRQAYRIRYAAALNDKNSPVPPHTSNGDEQRYSDHSASYSKPLLQDDVCLVNQAAWHSFEKALNSGEMSDFEAIILGGTGTLNGPQGAYAFDLACLDSSQFGNAPAASDTASPPLVPPFDRVTSSAYGTQLIEMYWAAMLRDVAFTDYVNNATAYAAAAELSAQYHYRGARNSQGKVTPDLLFRGVFQGETIGPYMSQFMFTPANFGPMPLSMQSVTYAPGIDYLTDTTTFLQAQNGINYGSKNQVDPQLRYLYDFRCCAAYTHVDMLYQAYLTGLMVLQTLKVPVNPGSPYAATKTQNGFDTFGAADFPAALGEVAARALHKVWYQKWLVHLTHRPEWGGGLVHQAIIGKPRQAVPPSNVLNSKAVAQTFSKYGTYLLPQAFPEGSPNHPSYPTGHGTVGGACITVLKFFFDGSYIFPNPLVPTTDGASLIPYTGTDAAQITVNTELNKLARNVSFGHGVGAGIHWRTDTDYSMLLGEAVALSYLQEKAATYHEKFTVNLTKLDGTVVTISNE